MIDAGSSHSQAILYRWPEKKLNCTGLVEQVDSCEIEPGISSYLQDEESEKRGGQAILDCVNKVLSGITRHENLQVPLNLAATAGMRIAKMASPKSVQMFIVIKDILSSKPILNVQKIGILSGLHEGLFAWVTGNYLNRRLQGGNMNSTVGVLDMGGASAQIAFKTNNNKTENKNEVNVSLFGTTHTVHTFSNLCFGIDEALARYFMQIILNSKEPGLEKKSPCHPKNSRLTVNGEWLMKRPCLQLKRIIKFENEYSFKGTGDAVKCAEIVDNQILNLEVCRANFVLCFDTLGISPSESMRFFAISSYFYTANVLELNKPVNIEEYTAKMTRYCSSDRKTIQKEWKRAKVKYLYLICFRLNFIFSSLKNIYNFTDKMWSNLEFAHKINGTELGWSLGMMVNETTRECHIPA